MAAVKWQQANGAKKRENGRPKTVRNRLLKKCENERKSAKNGRKQATTGGKGAKTIGMLFGDRFIEGERGTRTGPLAS